MDFVYFFGLLTLLPLFKKHVGMQAKNDIILRVILESALVYMKSELFTNPNLILTTVYQVNFYATQGQNCYALILLQIQI